MPVLAGTVLPQAVFITDGVWGLSTRVALVLSEVCKGESTRTIKIIPPLTMVHLPMGRSSSGSFLHFPPFYRTTKKFEERGTLMKLIDKNFTWEEVWEPLTQKFPDVALRKIPELLVPVEKINFGRLSRELT